MAIVRCPTCSAQFDPQTSTAMPFCSDRCRRIDLHRWLNEDIAIPVRELPEDAEQRPPAAEEEDD
jgi:endogenous inhibitor of DNA gyrase (YacG/DUF329 family)